MKTRDFLNCCFMTGIASGALAYAQDGISENVGLARCIQPEQATIPRM
jgi:hypothetical protein